MVQSNFTKEQAIKIYESGVYNDMTAKQIVDFQLFESKLCMPFGVFHGAVEEMLGRPVYTHEFSEPENLRKEYLAGKTFIIHP